MLLSAPHEPAVSLGEVAAMDCTSGSTSASPVPQGGSAEAKSQLKQKMHQQRLRLLERQRGSAQMMRGMAQANSHNTALQAKGPGMGLGVSFGPFQRDEVTPSPGESAKGTLSRQGTGVGSKDGDAPAMSMDGIGQLTAPSAFSDHKDQDLNSEATCELDALGGVERFNSQATPVTAMEPKSFLNGEDPVAAQERSRSSSKEEKTGQSRWWKPTFGLKSRARNAPQQGDEPQKEETVIQDIGDEGGMASEVQPLGLPRHSPEVNFRGPMNSITEVADLVSDCGDVDGVAFNNKPQVRNQPSPGFMQQPRGGGAVAAGQYIGSVAEAAPVPDFAGGIPGLAIDD